MYMINALTEESVQTQRTQFKHTNFQPNNKTASYRFTFISKLFDKETWNTISDFWMGFKDQETST